MSWNLEDDGIPLEQGGVVSSLLLALSSQGNPVSPWTALAPLRLRKHRKIHVVPQDGSSVRERTG